MLKKNDDHELGPAPLEMEFVSILTEMDDVLSYSTQANRYDIWGCMEDGEFKRVRVSVNWTEARLALRDFYQLGIAFVTPHIEAEECQNFFSLLHYAGKRSAELIKRADKMSKVTSDKNSPA